MMAKFKKSVQQFGRWYVLGYYHCNRCPYAWNDACLGCEDYDCGCVIYGDIRDTCRLLPPFRFLLGWGKKKRLQYAQAHEFDDVVKQYEEREGQEAAMTTAISNSLTQWQLSLHRSDFDGKTTPVEDLNAEIEVMAHWIVDDYEHTIHPVHPVTLRQEWGNLLRKTWKWFTRFLTP